MTTAVVVVLGEVGVFLASPKDHDRPKASNAGYGQLQLSYAVKNRDMPAATATLHSVRPLAAASLWSPQTGASRRESRTWPTRVSSAVVVDLLRFR